MEESISILLGAGFSAPKGYPIGSQLNDFILNCDGTEFGFHTDGKLCVDSTTGKRPANIIRSSHERDFDFCLALIKYYSDNIAPFDYEEFYDFIIDYHDENKDIDLIANKIYRKPVHNVAHQVINLRSVYTQIVGFYLKDAEGKKWYDDAPHYCKPIFPGYTGILNCLEQWGIQATVNVHTLNHDLFFERLSITDWIKGEICDGFEELGSPFYGELQAHNRKYHARLQHFTEKYDTRFRLFKLHGSRDYGVYYKRNGSELTPEVYIKTRYGVGFGRFLKETIDAKADPIYEPCWINYHADFLTGTTTKIERYDEPLLYKKLFNYFRINLKHAKQLVIIGYGAKDSEINKMILENFDYKNKPSYIVDPYPGTEVNKLKDVLGAKLIKEQLENLTLTDFT